jgi:hypothetical protein
MSSMKRQRHYPQTAYSFLIDKPDAWAHLILSLSSSMRPLSRNLLSLSQWLRA